MDGDLLARLLPPFVLITSYVVVFMTILWSKTHDLSIIITSGRKSKWTKRRNLNLSQEKCSKVVASDLLEKAHSHLQSHPVQLATGLCLWRLKGPGTSGGESGNWSPPKSLPSFARHYLSPNLRPSSTFVLMSTCLQTHCDFNKKFFIHNEGEVIDINTKEEQIHCL